jgi:hypothetical protein
MIESLYYHCQYRDIDEALEEPEELARWAYDNPWAILSHGLEDDPVLNYGNAQAQRIWEMPWRQFVRTPSRETAEPEHRMGRAVILERVKREGHVNRYWGIRKTASGRRFRMKCARIWEVRKENGDPAGIAAMFGNWEFLK